MGRTKDLPLTVYFHDNGECELYQLSKGQLQLLFEDGNPELAEKFKVTNLPMDEGYIPGYLIELAKRYGFEVDTI